MAFWWTMFTGSFSFWVAAAAAILFIVFPRKPDIVRAPPIGITGQLATNTRARRARRGRLIPMHLSCNIPKLNTNANSYAKRLVHGFGLRIIHTQKQTALGEGWQINWSQMSIQGGIKIRLAIYSAVNSPASIQKMKRYRQTKLPSSRTTRAFPVGVMPILPPNPVLKIWLPPPPPDGTSPGTAPAVTISCTQIKNGQLE